MSFLMDDKEDVGLTLSPLPIETYLNMLVTLE